jgi:arylsulfatase A
MRPATERPNLILINCDDLGYGDLGCYGSTVNQTPHLDRMASEGVRCTGFYMAAPVCSPSRGAMMTGCYPPRIGFGLFDDGAWVLFPGHSRGLHPDEITIARLLKNQGYATALVGKWHCGDQPDFLPTAHGFDQYFGLPYSNDMGRQAGWKQHLPPLPLLRDEVVIQQQPDQAALTERYVAECVRFIRDHRNQPFFLYFAHMYVHLPLYAPQHWLSRSQNGAYGACVLGVDWSVGVLLRTLAELALEENTLVVFTSDNGARGDYGGSNAPLRGRKGTTWEGGQRVPCIARWPGQLPAGAANPELMTAMDFLPTFARLAGGEAPQDRIIDGRDVFAALRGEAPSPHESFAYYIRNDLQAVRDDRWKLHMVVDGELACLLFDLKSDPGETSDCAAEHPQVVQRLLAAAEVYRQDLGDGRAGIAGNGRRPVGQVDDPKPLTFFDPDYPYVIAEYDLPDRG